MNCILLLALVFVNVCDCDIVEEICKNFSSITSKHILCLSDEFKGDCAGGKMENLTEYKHFIMDRHNYYRDLIASGHVQGYKPAVRMTAIWAWNEGMALFATLAAKQCDKSKQFNVFSVDYLEPKSASIYILKNEDPAYGIEEVINDAIMKWFDEYEHCPQSEIGYYTAKYEENCTGFYTMMCDRIDEMGCAMLTKIIDDKRTTVFACVYASERLPMEKNSQLGIYMSPESIDKGYIDKIYLEGPAASYCKTRHPRYHGLCMGEVFHPSGRAWSTGPPPSYGPGKNIKYNIEENGAPHCQATGALVFLLTTVITSYL